MLDRHHIRAKADRFTRARHPRNRPRVVALLVILAVFDIVIAGCAHPTNNAQKETPRTLFNHPGGDEVMIEVSSGGGLVLPVVRVDDSLPRVWISGDGRYLRQAAGGADTSALVALEERQIPEAALQSLIAEAGNAGLLADSPDYGTPKIFDAMNTHIVVVADGKRHDVLVRALGYPVTDLDAATVAARERVSHFIDMLQNPERIAGIGPPRAYVPAGLAVFVLGPASASAAAPPATWPLGDLATIGTPTDWPAPSARCLVVNDADRQNLEAAAAGVTRFAPWRSGDAVWEVAMRPLLPDEHSCADVIG